MTTGTAAPAPSGAGPCPRGVAGLTVLFDARCGLCTRARHWLERQSALVPLEFVPAASPEARMRFPGLDPAATLDDLTVVGDDGEV